MRIHSEIHKLIKPLNEAGIDVRLYRDRNSPNRPITWGTIERDGNVGSFGYRTYAPFGLYVSFAIKPNRATGSGLLILDEHGNEPQSVEGVVEAALKATSDTYYSPITQTVGRNHGTDHFKWSESSLVKVTGDEDFEIE